MTAPVGGVPSSTPSRTPHTSFAAAITHSGATNSIKPMVSHDACRSVRLAGRTWHRAATKQPNAASPIRVKVDR